MTETLDRDAELARSVLACAAGIRLVLPGTTQPDDASPSMSDVGGMPRFGCTVGSVLHRAAAAGCQALLTASSGVGPIGSPSRASDLRLVGTLRLVEPERCECCDDIRQVAELGVSRVMLTVAGRPVPIPLEDYLDPSLELNPGFLQRVTEHINEAHQTPVRQAVATLTSQPLASVLGAGIRRLEADGADLDWVTGVGAHRTRLVFARTATDADDLGDLLRDTLHPGIC